MAMSTLLGADLWCAERVDLSSVKKEVSNPSPRGGGPKPHFQIPLGRIKGGVRREDIHPTRLVTPLGSADND